MHETDREREGERRQSCMRQTEREGGREKAVMHETDREREGERRQSRIRQTERGDWGREREGSHA